MVSCFSSVKEVFAYREMLKNMVRRDLRGRYKASVLGFAWTFINPLLQLVVYTIVFSHVLRSGIEKYYLFLFVALIPWIAMASSLNDGANSVVGQANLVEKIYFPRRILPISTVTTCFVNMLLCMIVVLIVCQISIGVRWSFLWYLIPVFGVEYVLALGFALILSSLTVYFRDLQHIVGIFVMAWQFLSPVMYTTDGLTDDVKRIFEFNPMTGILNSCRAILYYKIHPDLKSLLYPFSVGLILLIFGWLVFGKLERRFAEEM